MRSREAAGPHVLAHPLAGIGVREAVRHRLREEALKLRVLQWCSPPLRIASRLNPYNSTLRAL